MEHTELRHGGVYTLLGDESASIAFPDSDEPGGYVLYTPGALVSGDGPEQRVDASGTLDGEGIYQPATVTDLEDTGLTVGGEFYDLPVEVDGRYRWQPDGEPEWIFDLTHERAQPWDVEPSILRLVRIAPVEEPRRPRDAPLGDYYVISGGLICDERGLWTGYTVHSLEAVGPRT